MALPKTLILGGGFAGVAAAKVLAGSAKTDVSLVNRSSYHIYHASLYEAAVEEITRETVMIPLEQVFEGKVEIIKDEVQKIDKDARRVYLESGDSRQYDYLVLALGAVSNDFGVPGVSEHAIQFREFRETILLRDHIRTAIHLSHERGRHEVNIAICGGGFSGVELAGELRHHLEGLAKEYGCSDEKMTITILEAGPQILPGMPQKVVDLSVAKLKELDVTISLSDPVAEIKPDGVRLKSGQWMPSDLTIWCAGTKPNPIPYEMNLPLDEKGRPAVNDNLAVIGRPEVCVAGDLAGFIDPRTNKGIAPQAHYAIEMGRVVGENILRSMSGRSLKKFVPDPLDVIIPVGHNYAVAYLHGTISAGSWPSFLRKLIEFQYLSSLFGPLKAWPKFWEELKVVAD